MRTTKWIVFLDGLVATTVTKIQDERRQLKKEEEKILFIAFLKEKCSIFS